MKDENKKLVRRFIEIFLLAVLILTLLLILITHTPAESFRGAAISTNGVECAGIGKSIFLAGGSIADVAVATIICEGITCPQSSGLGGGFLLMIYINKTRTVETLNARETAPRLSTPDMFKDNPHESVRGGKAVAVPGELKGLWELHQKYGKLPWNKLIEPNIKLARNGHVVSPYLHSIFVSAEHDFYGEPTLRSIYINPITNQTYKLNDIIKRPKLAETLEAIAAGGVDVLYEGRLAKALVKEVGERGGILTEEDLIDYRAHWASPLSTTLRDDNTLYTVPLPSSGAILVFMMNLLKDYDLQHNAISYHRITEAFKFAFAKRTFLGDEPTEEIKEMMRNLTSMSYAIEIRKMINDNRTSQDFAYYGAKFTNEDDRGTAHVSIVAPNGDAISVTSTINSKFGAFWRSESTGIIMNNEMDDFSTDGHVNSYGLPASPANFIKPGKQPMSSMAPTIVVSRTGDVRLAIGGAGGSRIPTGIALTIIKHLFMNETLNEAVAAHRIHHQLAPMLLEYETGFDSQIKDALKTHFGHEMQESKPDGGFAAVVGIAKIRDDLEGAVDPRRGGTVEYY